ncbi:predicted protein [Naegleria gruberi]|uniref:Predicted protein n=1 Tax=Naegleria gruberi TaxID=5762 RepID=D2VFZ6_NAEGR|nr:uncharacterized protein NAEGRDRAFT_49224 [Naegleria gruberi]EFC44170.1 predicted protein [Naegleria gruberi]|eukprot:XP_002676914.1 predicted protein [Naegleria gruberi strain NEG-M]
MPQKFSIYETSYNSSHHGAQLNDNLKNPIHKKAPLSDKMTYTADHKEHHLASTVADYAIEMNEDTGTYTLIHPPSKYHSEAKSSFSNRPLAPNNDQVHQENKEHIKNLEQDMKVTMAMPKDDPESVEMLGIYKSTTHAHYDKTKVFDTTQPQTIIYRDQQQRGKVKTGFKSFTHTDDMSAPSSKFLVENLDIQAKAYPQSFAATTNLGMIPTTKEEYNHMDEKFEQQATLKNRMMKSTLEKQNQPINEHYISEQKSQYAAKDPEHYQVDKSFVKPQVFSYRIDTVNGTPCVKASYTQPIVPSN